MKTLLQPYFERQLIEDRRQDGYWIEAFGIENNAKADLVGYGLNRGEVNWYQNPHWTKRPIVKLEGPVGMHYADINGDGRNDIVICYQYGATMVDCDPTGGKITWLENPGKLDGEWKHHYIGRTTAMHRLKVGHFTQDKKWEVLALPIVGEPHNIHSIAPVLLFTQPDNVYNAREWARTVIDDTNYRVTHGVSIKQFNRRTGSNLDSALLASEQGITWLFFDTEQQCWQREVIGTGEMSEVSQTGFKGSGDVDAGKIGADSFAFIAAVEPFHGNTVAVYCKDSDQSLTGITWRRVVQDVYGDPNRMGEGPGHFVICADFDKDGDDEFLVALRGPMPWQGVFYYKAVDVKNGQFLKWRVSSDSAARIAVADFDGDGRLDFATIGYAVEGYYCADDPQIVVFYNKFAPAL
jgi:hypothetical protein